MVRIQRFICSHLFIIVMKEIPIYDGKIPWACQKCGKEFIIQLEDDLNKRKPHVFKCSNCRELTETPDFKSKIQLI